MKDLHPARRVLAIAVVALAGGAIGVAGGCGGGGTETSPTHTRASDWKPVKSQPFSQPDEITSENGVLEATLDLARGPVEVAGSPVTSSVYNRSYPGPTLRLSPGDRIELDLVNNTDQVTNIHYHGLHVSPEGNSDNVFIHINPGETKHYSVQLPEDHPTGTYWYHSHAHGDSEEQVFGGMAGILIVEGLAEKLPDDLQGIEERTLALTTTRVREGELPTDDDELNPRYFGPMLVNGQLMPKLEMRPGEVQHWRLANVSATAWFRPALEGSRFYVIAEDGNPVEQVTSSRSLLLAPGKRYDVLVQAPDKGAARLETLPFDEGFVHFHRKRLADVEVSGDRVRTPEMPEEVEPFESLADAEVAKRRKFVFTQPTENGNIDFLINGQAFDPDVVNVRPKLGTVEEWTLRDETPEPHPFHIHVNDFEVMSVNGKPYEANGFQDVVPLPPNGELVIRQRFADYTGKFVFHCHILDHEDAGMMQVVRVVE